MSRLRTPTAILLCISATLISCQNLFKTQPPPASPDRPIVVAPGEPPPTTGADVVNVPEFVSVKAPRVGIIFGPGGAKTLAQIGALQEMERQKIPVVATVGLEWGALIGALYALNGQSHEVDWKMSQLPKVNFAATNFFSKKMQATTTAEYNKYLNKIFGSEKLESTKLPFACSYIKKESARSALISKFARNVIKNCWQYPPCSTWTRRLRLMPCRRGFLPQENGAELIVLVNVLENPPKDFASGTTRSGVVQRRRCMPLRTATVLCQRNDQHRQRLSMTDFEQRLRFIQVGKRSIAIDQLIVIRFLNHGENHENKPIQITEFKERRKRCFPHENSDDSFGEESGWERFRPQSSFVYHGRRAGVHLRSRTFQDAV